MKTTLTTTTLLFFIQFCFSQPVMHDENDFWVEINNPLNAPIYSFAIDEDLNIISGMGTDNGVHLSNNNGETWQPLGLENLSIYSLHIHKNGNVFAGTGGFNSLYRLKDFGEGWEPLLPGNLGNIISITNSHNGDLFVGNWGEIYKSSDFGETWNRVLELDNTQVISAFAENPEGVLFAGVTAFMGGGGVYRSTDNGDTWEHVGLHNKYIWSLAINSAGVVFAGSRGDHEYGGGGLYRSDDNGNTWVEVANTVLVTSLAIDPNDVLYIGFTMGVYRSPDNGENWELLTNGTFSVEGLSLSPDGYLYAYDNKLHRSVEPVLEAVYSVSATANPSAGGEVVGVGEYTHGQTATLTATPNDDYAFVNWTDASGVVLSSDTAYSFTVIKNIEMVANFELINSIEHIISCDVSIYPNPFTDILHIRLANGQHHPAPLSVKVFDPLGREIFSQSLGTLQSINLSSLLPGLYYISIEINGQRLTMPIIKTS